MSRKPPQHAEAFFVSAGHSCDVESAPATSNATLGSNKIEPSDHPSAHDAVPIPNCYLGCPVWACEGWVGSLYSSKQRGTWLAEYSSVFATVEGNSTFYALPSLTTVQRWADETREGFRFALKFPRSITHEKMLQNTETETDLFVQALRILKEADRLGPSILQLPPWFSRTNMPELERYLDRLPADLSIAVEVRHLDFFHRGLGENQLTDLLVQYRAERVIFDSRALYSAPPTDEFEATSQQRKPNLPVRPIAIGDCPMLRFVGRNRVDVVQPWIDEWVPVIAEWIAQGKTPYVFTHSPNDHFAPEFAVRFYDSLKDQVSISPELPKHWPGHLVKRQQQLF